jgi:hypothetical protein
MHDSNNREALQTQGNALTPKPLSSDAKGVIKIEKKKEGVYLNLFARRPRDLDKLLIVSRG